MNTEKLLALCRKHLGDGTGNDSSARACLADAVDQHDAGNDEAAQRWALKSLSYSVGIFHEDYLRAL